MEFRRQQADAERNRLQIFFNQLRGIEDERVWLSTQLAESRDEAIGSGTVSGADFAALSHFKRYVGNRVTQLDNDRRSLSTKIREQQQIVVAADRRITLLEKLKGRQRGAWLAEEEKELESLATDSFMAKLAAGRRIVRKCRRWRRCRYENQMDYFDGESVARRFLCGAAAEPGHGALNGVGQILGENSFGSSKP